MKEVRGRFLTVAALLLFRPTSAVPQVVTTHTLCEPKLPPVAPDPSYFVEPAGQHPQLSGSGSIRFEALAGKRQGAALYRLVDRGERVKGQFPVDFGLFLDGQGGVFVREHALTDKKVGEYVSGDVMAIAVIDGGVHYLRNGERLSTSGLPPRYPLEAFGCTAVLLSNEWSNQPSRNEAPVAAPRASRTRIAGRPVHFDASRSTDADGTIRRYRWDFGDGQQATGVRAQHVYPDAGFYIVKLQVMDNRLETGEGTLDIQVSPPPDPVSTP